MLRSGRDQGCTITSRTLFFFTLQVALNDVGWAFELVIKNKYGANQMSPLLKAFLLYIISSRMSKTFAQSCLIKKGNFFQGRFSLSYLRVFFILGYPSCSDKLWTWLEITPILSSHSGHCPVIFQLVLSKNVIGQRVLQSICQCGEVTERMVLRPVCLRLDALSSLWKACDPGCRLYRGFFSSQLWFSLRFKHLCWWAQTLESDGSDAEVMQWNM